MSPEHILEPVHYLQYLDEVIKTRWRNTNEWNYMFCAYIDFDPINNKLNNLVCYPFNHFLPGGIDIRNELILTPDILSNIEIQIVEIPNE